MSHQAGLSRPAPDAEAAAPQAREGTDAGQAAPLSEWIAAGVGLLLVLASMAVLGWYAWQGDRGVPSPRIEVGAPEAVADGRWHVALQVSNAGRGPAADLQLSGTLSRPNGEVVERSQARIDHLPAGSRREAGLFFQQDPRNLQLVVRAEGYQRP